jgi:hypothetical protein
MLATPASVIAESAQGLFRTDIRSASCYASVIIESEGWKDYTDSQNDIPRRLLSMQLTQHA